MNWPHIVTEAFAAALGERRMLLVIDGLSKRADVEPFLVGGPRCVRLVTTRRTGLVRGRELVVDAMTDAEARALLCRDVASARRRSRSTNSASTSR